MWRRCSVSHDAAAERVQLKAMNKSHAFRRRFFDFHVGGAHSSAETGRGCFDFCLHTKHGSGTTLCLPFSPPLPGSGRDRQQHTLQGARKRLQATRRGCISVCVAAPRNRLRIIVYYRFLKCNVLFLKDICSCLKFFFFSGLLFVIVNIVLT